MANVKIFFHGGWAYEYFSYIFTSIFSDLPFGFNFDQND